MKSDTSKHPQQTLTEQEAFDLLNEVCTDKRTQQVSFYDAILWTVPADFDHAVLPKDFDLWTYSETEKTIRKITHQYSD